MSTNLFQNFQSSISIRLIQIATDCSVFDRFCVFVCCLLILMNLWLVLEGMNHREAGIQQILHRYEFSAKDGTRQIYLRLLCLARGVKQQRQLGGNPILFLFFTFCSCLVINNSSILWLYVVLIFNYCLCQVEPLGRLGESLVTLAVKNRNFSAHENCCHFYLESLFS